MTFTLDKLKALVDARLGGDRARLSELFETEEVFIELRAQSNDADWYHFSVKTFDGQYLIQTPNGFLTYQQDRGVRSHEQMFESLKAAAIATFGPVL